ncbi:MAG: cobalt ABC transporter substrate-binding protein CbiN [Bacillus thermozeamaize]|jgi:cobalt transport protein|uniref:Cobalt transport protein CbiN n=1 Tax=Bacillus thermozeamaize TaxID=230954 RepID=A0A1Y3PHY8_9BACI|nr:MAG: cobalt ABC transporter substrate-binding protein CbiN [Bacillus thermozeamaize]
MKRNGWKTNAALVGLLVALVAGPLWLIKSKDFSGADAQATEAISQMAPDYRPWFEPLFAPPGSEVESFLFALQAGIGAAVIGYIAGLLRGRMERERTRGGSDQ